MSIPNLKYFLFFLLLTSCGRVKKQVEDNDPLAIRFRLIDGKLKDFASQHNAEIATVWSKSYRNNPDDTDTYPIKRIVWSDSSFNKAIIIQPYSDPRGVDSTAWDFINIAWLEDGEAKGNPSDIKKILTKVNFEVIEKNIDQLLSKSEKNLQEIKIEDLK